jgi:hypothetical protein
MALTELFRKKDDEDTTESTSENTTRYYSSMDRFRSSFENSSTNGDSGSGSNSSSSNSSNSSHSGYSNYLYHLNNPIQKTTEKTNRGVMDRILGTLGYTGVVEGLYNLADDDPNSTFISGLGEGLKYMNPFTDDVSGRHTFSDVLEEAGWEDKEDGKLNIGRAVAGLAGDILLDPITYLNPFSALSKVVKGSGVGTDVIKGLSDVNKAEDIVKEVKAVTGGVNKANVSHIKALDLKTARKIVTDSMNTAPVTNKATLWSSEDIDKMANDLMVSFNRKIQKLSSGGEDFTFGLSNFPFANKIKIGGKQLDSFKKTIMTSDQLRSLGDRTIAPYFNDLTKKLRTSRWGKRFSKNAELEDLAKTDFDEAVRRYYLRELKTGIFRLGLDQNAFKTSNIFRDYYDSLNEVDKKDFLSCIERGDFVNVDKLKQLIKELKDQYGIEYNDDVKEWHEKLRTQMWDFLNDFDKNSGRTKIKNRRAKLEEQGYYDLPPIKGEYATDDEFNAVKEAWEKRNPNKKYEDEVYGYKDESLSGLNNKQKRGFREFGEAAGKLTNQYAPDAYKNTNIGLADNHPTYPMSDNAFHLNSDKPEGGFYVGSDYLKRPTVNIEDSLEEVEGLRQAGGSPTHVGIARIYRKTNFESTGLHEAGHKLGKIIFQDHPDEWDDIKKLYRNWKYATSKQSTKLEKAVSKRATDNIDEFFTEMLSDVILHNPQTSEAAAFRNIVENALGKKLEQWEPLKFLNDDQSLKRYERGFRQYTRENLGDEFNWWDWDNVDDLEKKYLKKLGVDENAYAKMQKINRFYEQLKRVEKFGAEGESVAKLWIKEMSEVAKREVDAGFLSKEQAASWFGRYIPHFSKEKMASFKNKEGFVLSEEDMDMLEELVKNPMNGNFNPDIFGTLERFNYSRTTPDTITRINARSVASTGKEVLETSLADIYLARVLGSNKLLYGTEVQNFLRKNFLTSIDNIKDVPDMHEAVGLYREIRNGIYVASRKNAKLENKNPIVLFRNYMSELTKLGGGQFEATFSPNNVLQKLNEKQVEFLKRLDVDVYHASKGVINDVNSVTRVQKAQMTSSLMKTYDKFMHIWKLQNTIVTPGFHLQNIVSNAFQSFMAIGSDAFNPSKLIKSCKIYMNPDPKQTIKIGNKVWTYQELNYAAKKTGVVDEMFHTFEFSSETPGGMIKALPRSLDPTDTEDFLPYKWATKIGGSIEGVQRLNLFISALKQTDNDAAKASELVDKFLFDYSDVTEFEQDVVKRIIPFYTFMKKNFPMELEQMIEQPTTYTSLQKIYNNFEKSGSNEYYGENDRSEWRQEHIQLPFTTEDGDTYGIADQLPYNQIERILDPQKVLGQTSPVIKTPIELLTGKYVYTGSDIENVGKYLAGQTSWSKIPAVASNYDDPVQKRNYIIGQLTGFPIGKINRD